MDRIVYNASAGPTDSMWNSDKYLLWQRLTQLYHENLINIYFGNI